MFNINYNPDVLTCLANLSNDEVFTPPHIANQMLDLLPNELWSDKTVTFLDPCCKSGVFLREIAKRLKKGLEEEIPNLQERLNHIYTKQLYGIAITELTSLLSRRTLYCSKNANGEFSVCESFDKADGNIRYNNVEHHWKGNKCKHCGATKSIYERGNEHENYAYEFIHRINPEEIFNMKFDVIIGNPPYHLSTGDTSDSPIYQKFVEQAMALEPRYLCMVTPSRWFTGGKGLDSYRERMIADRRLRIIVDFPNSMESFPGVEIKGGVSYFLWVLSHQGDCHFITYSKGEIVSESKRDLREGKGVVIRDNRASSIIEKVKKHSGDWLSNRVSPQTPFGIYTNFANWHSNKRPGDVQLFKRGLEEAWTSQSNVTTRKEWIPKIKVIMSYAYNGGDALPHQITGVPFIVPGNSAVTQTYLVAGVFDEQEEAENYVSYLKTRFVRFLIRQRKISQHNRPDTFAFVPDLQMKHKWTDEELYKKYGITENEISFIESIVRPME